MSEIETSQMKEFVMSTTNGKDRSHHFYDVNSLGGNIKTYTREEVALTPKFCTEFLEELQEFEGERNMRPHWADVLVGEMERDNFRFEHVILASAELEGMVYRVNGQHTCWARRELADEKRFSLPVTLLRYKLKSKEELRNLYSSFDQHGRRTRGHVIMAQLVGFQGWANVSKKSIMMTSQGFPLYRWEEPGERSKFDSRDVAYLLKTEEIELGVKVGEFLTKNASGNGHNHVRKAAVIATMLMTFKKNAQASMEFWVPVLEGTGFEKAGDPRNRYRSFLQSSTVGTGGRTQGKKNLTNEEMIRGGIFAWNAWRSGEERSGISTSVKGSRPKLK